MVGYIKFNRSGQALLKANPNAFILLTHLALKAWRGPGKYKDLNPSEAIFSIRTVPGLSVKQVRLALDYLTTEKHILVVKKTKRGTIIKLCESGVYDINPISPSKKGHTKGHKKGHTKGHTSQIGNYKKSEMSQPPPDPYLNPSPSVNYGTSNIMSKRGAFLKNRK